MFIVIVIEYNELKQSRKVEMTHPAEAKSDKAAELKEKLARLKSGGNGQTASPVPSNGNSVTVPAKKRGGIADVPGVHVSETPVVKKSPVVKKEAVKKEPAKKEPAKTPVKVAKATKAAKAAKAPAPRKAAKAEEKAPRKAKKAAEGDIHRSADRDKKGDGLRPVERDIIKIVKSRRGKPISIRDIAITLFGEDKVTAAYGSGKKDNELIRVVRNGIRLPCSSGILARWSETGDPDAKRGYVMMAGVSPPPVTAAAKAAKVAKEKVKEKIATKKAKLKSE